MYSPNKSTRIFSLIGAFVLAATTGRAVDPPPDGGYPNGNTAEGTDALFSLTLGVDNTAMGFDALFNNTLGYDNTAMGFQALYGNTSGRVNTAIGSVALQSNTTGYANTALGAVALVSNTTGINNTATGASALRLNTGSYNTATGASAMYFSTTGSYNTATGCDALENNSTGSENTAMGFVALFENTTGSHNTASGNWALARNTTGGDNTAIGSVTLLRNKHGSRNIALGAFAGSETTGNNNIDIGNEGVLAESNTIRIGRQETQRNAYIAGISGSTVAGGVAVIIDTNGHVGTVTSSARYKEAIKPMDEASEAILSLQPVTFHYKKELDPRAIPQFGLVAEQVEKINPDLVARDDQGKAYTVRYEAVDAMLLNEFLKEHRKVEAQSGKIQEQEVSITGLKSRLVHFESTLADQQTQIKALTASLKEQAAQIRQVSARLDVSKASPRVVTNN